MKYVVVVVVLMSCFIGMAWSHCHDDDEDGNDNKCEDLMEHMYTPEYWSKPNNNTVPYYVNNTYRPTYNGRTLPPLGGEVNRAAALWHQIWFCDEDADECGRIQFGLEYKGATTLRAQANPNDGKNVVSYGVLSSGLRAAVFTTHYPAPYNNRIKEQDMVFAYNLNWYDHSSRGPGRLCIKEVAAHEWGHFGKLHDVTYEEKQEASCPRYADYTMYNAIIQSNTHDRETLECEDKYILYVKYGFIPGTEN